MRRVLRPEEHLRPYRHNLWRVIEAQSRISTLMLVDTFAEHDLLEAMLEETKPPVPKACAHLDYRFWSPFRYGCYPKASRFRRAGRSPGVWYGAEEPLTAVCELVWGRLRFHKASPATPMPRKPVELTAVMADIHSPLAIDLTTPELAGAADWMAEDHTACLDLAAGVRAAAGEVIRYASARHPDRAANVAVLVCRAFAQPGPIGAQTWHMILGPALVKLTCETTRQRFSLAVGATRLEFLA